MRPIKFPTDKMFDRENQRKSSIQLLYWNGEVIRIPTGVNEEVGSWSYNKDRDCLVLKGHKYGRDYSDRLEIPCSQLIGWIVFPGDSTEEFTKVSPERKHWPFMGTATEPSYLHTEFWSASTPPDDRDAPVKNYDHVHSSRDICIKNRYSDECFVRQRF